MIFDYKPLHPYRVYTSITGGGSLFNQPTAPFDQDRGFDTVERFSGFDETPNAFLTLISLLTNKQ